MTWPGRVLVSTVTVLCAACVTADQGESESSGDSTTTDAPETVRENPTITAPADSGQPQPVSTPPEVTCIAPTDVDQIVAEWADEHRVVGAIAGIYDDGQFAALSSTGVRDINESAPLSSDSPMRIGSITKTFSATLALAMVERGDLLLGDQVSTFLPGAPDSVTVEQLLSHESPFRDGDIAGALMQAVTDPTSVTFPAETTDRLLADTSSGTTDVRQVYASSNYVVLDQLIASAGGEAFEDLLAADVLTPHGLTSTGFDAATLTLPSPHERLDPTQTALSLAGLETDRAVRAAGASGALISTPADLGAFFAALFAGQIVSADSLQMMLDVSSPTRTDYGLGIGVYSAGGRDVYGHNGRTVGFASSVRHDPSRHTTVIVLSNDGGAPTSTLAQQLSAIEVC